MNFGDLLSSEKRDYFYIMHLSYGNDEKERKRLWNYATENNIIGLDLPDKVKKDWVTLSELERQVVSNVWTRQFDLFCNEMKTGDYVLALNGQLSLLGIAKIKDPKHRFDKRLTGKEKTGFFDHIRRVDWKLKYEYGGIPLSQQLKGFNRTLFKVTPQSSWWDSLKRVNL